MYRGAKARQIRAVGITTIPIKRMGIIFPPKIEESGETIKPTKQDIKFPRATANIIGVFGYFLDSIKKSDSPKALIKLNMPPKNILPDGLFIGA